MPVRLNSTGGGSVTLDVPNTATNTTLTLPSSTGAASQMLSSTGSAMTWAYPGMVYIGTQTANNSASIGFTSGISSAFDFYMLLIENVLLATTTTASLFLQISSNGGLSYNTTGYTNNAVYLISGGPGYAATTAGFELKAVSYTSVRPIMGTLYLGNANDSAARPRCWGQMLLDNNPQPFQTLVNGNYDTVGTFNAVRLIAGAGNLTSGKMHLFGLAK